MALPYWNVFIGDIHKDTDLLSPATFGGYVRLLFKMHNAQVRGEVTYTLPQLCRVFGAKDIEETVSIVKELTDPSRPEGPIVDYKINGDNHFLKNRRMVRETALSKARSEAGKKGAEATNKKTRQNTQVADVFAPANGAASSEFAEEVVTSNDATNNPANYGIGIGINTGNEKGKEGVGEKEKTTAPISQGAGVLIVPEMVAIWKKYRQDYVIDPGEDYHEIRSIAEKIATAAKLDGYTEIANVDRIKELFDVLIQFTNTHSLYSTYQLSQVRKYFNQISTACKAAHVKALEQQGGPKNGKKSIIHNNVEAAQGAHDIMAKKYKQQGGEHES